MRDTVLKKFLKQKCKNFNIKNISKLSIEELWKSLDRHSAALRIQKFCRKILGGSSELICPITMDRVVYPCFPFKPKGQIIYIYYNLEDLVNYLLNTGDFRDPKTREQYSEQILQKIDVLKKAHKISGKSVYKSSKNLKFYKNKKEKEESILVIERCLDDIISSMRNLLENIQRRRHAIHTLNTLFFMSFRIYYRRLVVYSRDSAGSLIERTITLINETVNRPLRDGEIDSETSMLRDTIIQFLYQVRFDELESRE